MSVRITYFVHGTTTDNEEHLRSGWYDVDLSELGEKQNLELRETLKQRGDKYDVVFCSDLKRAVRSANRVFKDDCPIIIDKRLRECNYGDLNRHSGKDFKEIEYYIENKHPNGESYKDVEARIKGFLDFLKENYDNKHIAIVAHRFPQLAIIAVIEKKTWKQALEHDWRETKSWQPGWEYVLN